MEVKDKKKDIKNFIDRNSIKKPKTKEMKAKTKDNFGRKKNNFNFKEQMPKERLIIKDVNFNKFFEKHENKKENENILNKKNKKLYEIKKKIKNKKNNQIYNVKNSRKSELHIKKDDDNEKKKKKKIFNTKNEKKINEYNTNIILEEKKLEEDLKKNMQTIKKDFESFEIDNIPPYEYIKIPENSKLKKIKKLEKPSEKFINLITLIKEEEYSNLKKGEIFDIKTFQISISLLNSYLKTLIKNQTKINEENSKIYINKINMKNLYIEEQSLLINDFLGIFTNIRNNIKKIEGNNLLNPLKISNDLKNNFMTIKKNTKYFQITNSKINKEFKNKNEFFLKKNVSFFCEIYKYLEFTINEIQGCLMEIEKLNFKNSLNKKIIYEIIYEPMKHVFEAKAIDVCTDLLDSL